MKFCNYKCVITDKNNHDLDIHHIFSFSNIIKETLLLLNLPLYSEISYYNNFELKLLENKCLELHYKHGLGACLSKKLHIEFHSLYGKKNFTPENFYEFYKNKTGSDYNINIKRRKV